MAGITTAEAVAIEPAQTSSRSSNTIALIALAAMYFMLGFITCLNDTLVPFFKRSFTLSYTESSLVQFYFFVTYGLFSIPIGKVVARLGYQRGIICGFLFSAAGSLLFLPAASFHEYYLFLGALFIVALGIVFMQVAANPYIIALGSPKTASARLNMIQSVGSVGTIVAPLFGAATILPKLEHSLSSSALVLPYIGIAAVLLMLSITMAKLTLPRFATRSEKTALDQLPKQSAFSFRNLNLGAVGIFCYVGIEVAIASFLTNYISDTLQIKEDAANRYVAFYWGGMLVGRLIGVVLLRRIKATTMLVFNAIVCIGLIVLSVSSAGNLAVWSLIGVGLFNSVMFAIIFSLSVAGLGKFATQASGILSTAISGGAVIVILQGFLIDKTSWATAFLIPAVCYIYIIFYGLNGYKTKINPAGR
ncbi:MAG: sugar MFS transporter [Chitinophagaceae bacterium]|nr:sugar MFS transporter [Chitinophagaceae bacterium]